MNQDPDSTQNQGNNTNSSTSRRSNRSVKTQIITFVVIIISVVALMWFNLLEISFHTTPSKTVEMTIVCNDDDVRKYNEAMGYEYNENIESPDVSLEDLAKSIEKRGGSDSDATCQYILWQYAYTTNNKDDQRKYVDRLVNLNKEGIYVNNLIQSPYSLPRMQELTKETVDAETKGRG